MELNPLLIQLGFDPERVTVTQFRHEEDEECYRVWKIVDGEQTYVLKAAKEYEADLYRNLLCEIPSAVPRLYRTAEYEGATYLLMEYIEGEDLCRCDRARLTMALDALIAIQRTYWEDRTHDRIGCPFAQSLARRTERGKWLNDAELEAAYQIFLQKYETLPRTLCHDDLLPFNVLVSDRRAVILDWEIAGILPYPTSLARLLAHCAEDEHAFFFMTEADRDFAVRYYYDQLIAPKGITYEEYHETLNYFLLFEYCEWIMLGNKYEDADMARYREYFDKAKKLVKTIKQEERS